MKRANIFLGLLLAGSLVAAAACGGGGKPADNTEKTPDKVTRPQVADEYQGRAAPADVSVEEGKKLFDMHCASCHGPNGDGDAVVGQALNPPAGDLTNGGFQDAVGDDYIFWRVSEGGGFSPFNSGMTPFKTLSEEQRWNLVAFVRSLKK